jgi:hypothetical protein
MRSSALPLSFVVLLFAAPGQGAGQDYYADVRPLLVERCMGCHTEEGIGWSMEDAEETFERHRQIAGAVSIRKMPPWLAEPGHQEYVGDLSLDDDVVGMVAAWRDAGYPKGQPRPDPGRAMGHSALAFTADLSIELNPGEAYLPDQSMDDDYRCFIAEWTGEERAYVTGFRTVPGNESVAHHTVIFAIEPGMVDRFRELDAEEEGLGYQCFGGALPSSLDRDEYEARYPDGLREMDEANWWLAHWAPGMYGHHFPEGTGILMEPGAGLVVQMHYYTGDAPGESDAGTRLDFQLESDVERPAFHFVQTYNPWLAGKDNGSMVIPPGQKVTYVTDEDLGSWVPYAASIAEIDEERIQAFEVHSANLHMHAFGHSGVITLTDENGRTETLLSVPKWDLHWQRDFTFSKPKVLSVEELEDTSIRVQCTYENNTGEVVYGGFGSYDEMCFNFSYIALQLDERVTEANGSQR